MSAKTPSSRPSPPVGEKEVCFQKRGEIVRLAIAGACGRMGQRIGALACTCGQFKITGVLERTDHPAIGSDYGQVLGIGDLGVAVETDAGKVIGSADVVVDFAVGGAILQHVALAVQAKKPLVTGTTGLKEAEVEKIKEASKVIPCVMSPNMSPGVNVILQMVGAVAKALGPAYDIDIVETHHKMKKDAPSGTALALAQALKEAVNREIIADGRSRSSDEILIHAVRSGDVVGDHTVAFAGPGERIEITHRATSRDTFAMGALRAAAFAAKAKPGLYGMSDVMITPPTPS